MTSPASGFARHCRRALPVVVAACGLLSLAAGTSAQEFPAKPIKLINGFAAGGNVDVVGRIIGQKMAEGLGQPGQLGRSRASQVRLRVGETILGL